MASKTKVNYNELPVMEGSSGAAQEWLCPDGHVCIDENGGLRCEVDGFVYNDKGQRVATEDDVANGDYEPTDNDPEWMRELWEANHGD